MLIVGSLLVDEDAVVSPFPPPHHVGGKTVTTRSRPIVPLVRGAEIAPVRRVGSSIYIYQ